MRRKWTIEAIKDLVSRKNKYIGKNLSGFFKQEKMSEQNFYNLKKKLKPNNNSRKKPSVIEIIPKNTSISKAELVFPSGHTLVITSNNMDDDINSLVNAISNL